MTNAASPTSAILPSIEVCKQARVSRDPRFDGRFFVGVLTTGIYCRTICPARLPKEDNVQYLATAASAQDAGFRPCLRCRPEAALPLPEWTLASDTVLRGLRHIEAGYLNDHSIAELAGQLSVSQRHVTRLFAQELGTSPNSVAQVCRAKVAKGMLSSSNLPLAEVAFHAGYGSLSRFNYELKKLYQATPSQLRKSMAGGPTSHVEMQLPVSLPYNYDWVFEYLKKRALKGMEIVTGGPGTWCYQRLLRRGVRDGVSESGGAEEWISVCQSERGLTARIPVGVEPLHSLLTKIRRVFDLNADGATLHEFLGNDKYLATWVEQAPGLRVPGAWDGFETAVRAILGQQVSVQRGCDLANKMIDQYGGGLFPSAACLLDKDVAELGMPGRRGRAVVHLAKLVDAGDMLVDECQDFDALQNQLESLEGVGPWTANYIRMRALKDPDAFPDNDWVVLKQLDCTAAKARQKAAAWQPWRAYALMYLWYAAGVRRAAKKPLKQ